MLPNGILGIIAGDPAIVTRFLEAHHRRCAEDQSIRTQQIEGGLVSLGSVVSTGSDADVHFSRSADGTGIGVFNGVAFDDWRIERRPHDLLSLTAREIDSGANGMFQAAAANEDALTLITDPWGTLPVYTYRGEEVFAFSSSLHALADCLLSDNSIRNRGGVCQLLAFGRTIDGQTVYPGIRCLGRAMVCRLQRQGRGFTFTEEEYFSPFVEPSEYRGIDDDIVDSFRAAVRKLYRKSDGDMICTLSGGLDSRTIASVVAAEKWEIPFATHAVREGHDLRIARTVADRLHLRHHVVELPAELPLDHRAHRFLQGSNGLLPFDNYHVMWAFPEYAKLGHYAVDGVHTSIEGRWFLRNNSRHASSREAFYHLTSKSLLQPDILRHVRGTGQHILAANEILHGLIPDPAAYASPGCCADVFNVRMLIPNHNTDGALLQNHFLRFISPYLDRDYVSVVSRVAERRRWEQHPQRLIVRKLAPRLSGLERSYSDILSLPTDNPYLLRLPVALERLYGKMHLDRLPWLYGKLSRRAPSIGSTLGIDEPLLLNGWLAEYFNLPRDLQTEREIEHSYRVPGELLPFLHLVMNGGLPST